MLHNFCLENNLPPPENNENIDEWDFGILEPHPNDQPNVVHNRANVELVAGRRVRDQIIRNYFY